MLARLIASQSRHFRYFSSTLSPQFYLSSSSSSSSPRPFLSPQIPKFHFSTHFICRHFSTTNNNNGETPPLDFWKMGQEERNLDDIFDTHDGNLTDKRREDVGGKLRLDQEQTWEISETVNEGDGGLFEEFGGKESGGTTHEEWSQVPEYEPWKLDVEEKLDDVFSIDGDVGGDGMSGEGGGGTEKEREMVRAAQRIELEKEERALMNALNGNLPDFVSN